MTSQGVASCKAQPSLAQDNPSIESLWHGAEASGLSPSRQAHTLALREASEEVQEQPVLVWISRYDVRGLCLEFPSRLQDLVDNEGDQLRK